MNQTKLKSLIAELNLIENRGTSRKPVCKLWRYNSNNRNFSQILKQE